MFIEESLPTNQPSSRALQQTLFSLLQHCNSIEKLTQIHTQLLINGFSQKSFLLVKLVSLYIASGNLIHGHRIFSNTENPSTNLWNQIIRGYAWGQEPRKSVGMYNRMVGSQAAPDGYTYSFVLSACARLGLLIEGEQIHARVLVNGFCTNAFVQTNLVNIYSVRGMSTGSDIGNAYKVFDEMSVRNCASWNSMLKAFMEFGHIDNAQKLFAEMPERNAISWTTMIFGYARSGKCKQALSLFAEMERGRVQMDQVVLVAALSACAQLGDLKLGKRIHSYVEAALCVENKQLLVSLQNALIHMYASCGLIQDAYKVFKVMPKRSTVSWTSMITGFAKLGCAQEALNLFHLMQMLGGNGVRPDEITFIGVLCACSHAGFIDMGCHFFKNMIRHWGIEPRIEHYGCMVDLLSRAGCLDEATRFIETMPMKPNDAIWGALLGGCRIHKQVDLASSVAQNLVPELNSEESTGHFVLLANIYATAKKWSDVAIVRQKMVEMGMRKFPGQSRIRVNGVVCEFMAADKTHEDSSLIYGMVDEITRQAKKEGYEVDTSEVTLDTG